MQDLRILREVLLKILLFWCEAVSFSEQLLTFWRTVVLSLLGSSWTG